MWCHKCEKYFNEVDEDGYPVDYVCSSDSNFGRLYYHLGCYEELLNES